MNSDISVVADGNCVALFCRVEYFSDGDYLETEMMEWIEFEMSFSDSFR